MYNECVVILVLNLLNPEPIFKQRT